MRSRKKLSNAAYIEPYDPDKEPRWCPEARLCASADRHGEGRSLVPFNRVYVSDDNDTNIAGALCIGRSCSKWVWTDPHKIKGYCGLIGGEHARVLEEDDGS